jgi:hypothetical protein
LLLSALSGDQYALSGDQYVVLFLLLAAPSGDQYLDKRVSPRTRNKTATNKLRNKHRFKILAVGSHIVSDQI